MNKLKQKSSPVKQKGAVTLLVSVMLLFAVTLITVFSSRVGVLDQRIAANEYRHKEAKAAADAALEQAAAFLENNIGLYNGDIGGDYPWADCTDADIQNDFPCTIGGTTYDLAYDGDTASTTTIEAIEHTTALSSGAESKSYLVYNRTENIMTVIGTGKSVDTTADAYVQASYAQTFFITPGAVPPLLASGLDLSGSFTIIADPRVTYDNTISCKAVTPEDVSSPNGPLSLWTDGAGSGGTWQTCSIDNYVNDSVNSSLGSGKLKCVYEYDDTDDWSNCACESDANLSDSGAGSTVGYTPRTDHPDIKGAWNVKEDFPDSPFEHFFQDDVAGVEADALKDGIHIDGDCDDNDIIGYELTDKRIVWCTGNASFNSAGTQDNPIIVVAEGTLKLNAGANVWGIFVGLSNFTANGGAKVHGAVIVEDTDTYTFLTNGNYEQIYDFCVISNLQDPSINSDIAKIQYSTIDFQPN